MTITNSFPKIGNIFRDLWHNACDEFFRRSLFSLLNGTLLRILWNRTAFPDPKTSEEENLLNKAVAYAQVS